MKKIIIMILFVVLCIGVVYNLGAGTKAPVLPGTCPEIKGSITFHNVKLQGDQLLGWSIQQDLQWLINLGYTITATIKNTDSDCTYSGSKIIHSGSNKNDVVGNTVSNIGYPSRNFQVTVKIESPCVYDGWYGGNVKFTWTKTVQSNSSFDCDMGFGQKVACPNGSGSGSSYEPGYPISKYRDEEMIPCEP